MENKELIKCLSSFIINKEELEDVACSLNVHLQSTFKKCFIYSLNNSSNGDEKLFEIDSLLDYVNEELNTGHWSKVPIHFRHIFTASSFLKCLIILKTSKPPLTVKELKECLNALDLGLLLGAPLQHNPDLLTESAKIISKEILKLEKFDKIKDQKKRTLDNEHLDFFNTLNGKAIDIVSCPSLEAFNNKYFIPQIPVKLTDCMNHWPAMIKWMDVNYLLEVAGNRTVPIEIGSHYVDENWSQKLMPLRDFIKNYYLNDENNLGYLAQHNLFEQISELKGDICVPEYCCLTNEDDSDLEPDVNAWFGPKGTLSPLHFDPKNNILCQVFGFKLFILFSPQDTPYLYPHEGNFLSNTAQVDPLNPDLAKFPDYTKAKVFKCLLEPGEMLFIPKKWWHYVKALDKSFSVSFWWN